MSKKQHTTILLASKSPRRAELLKRAHVPYEVANIEVDEIYDENISVRAVPSFLAEKKAIEALKQFPDSLILCADSVVVHQNKILEKPADREQATNYLKVLSESEHEVITSFCLCDTKQKITIPTITKVRFNHIPEQAIIEYVDSRLPYDKAGAYGIQDWIGIRYIQGITGCYENVMGLSIQSLIAALENFNFKY